MPIQVLKKSCTRCGKPFFTYEKDKEFCTNVCEGRYKYAKHFGKEEKLVEHCSNCAYCREEIYTRGRIAQKFCNEKCKRDFTNQENRKKTLEKSLSEEKIKKPRKKGLSYEELNRRAEWKRVFDDESWLYKKNRDKI